MVICIEKLLMSLATLGWMLVSGPAATCSAFSVMTGTEMVGLHCQRTISSLHAQRQTPNLSNICIESNDVPVLLSAVSRRNMIVSSVAFIASQVATKANADVSDGNALPEGAQQFARTIKLKTDLKVWNRIRYKKLANVVNLHLSPSSFTLFRMSQNVY